MSTTGGNTDWRAAAASLGFGAAQLRSAPSLFHVAHALSVRNQRQAAEGAYRELLRVDPKHLAGLRAFLVLLQSLGRTAEAAECRRRLIELEVARLGLPPEEHAAALAFRLGVAGLQPRVNTAPPAYVARAFDEYAEHFDDHLVRVLGYRGPEVVHTAVTQTLGAAAHDLEVLDAGCGTGLAAPLFRPLARRLDGVDLSPQMLERARTLGLYDHLDVGELTEVLSARPSAYDLVVAVDVLGYVGDLAPVFTAAAAALRPAGWFALSVESHAGLGYVLRSTGRYAHALAYVRGVAPAAGLVEVSAAQAELRRQHGKPVVGHVVVLQKAPGIAEKKGEGGIS
jgi:predicted TPR repeat methyltransferase